MLHQNWFMSEKFVMFVDYGYQQIFFDTETKNIYVGEECGPGITNIREITKESELYKRYYDNYTYFLDTGK